MSDALAAALIEHLCRIGVLDADDVDAMADRLDEQGEDDAAHEARAALVEATVGTITPQERADDARGRFRVVDGGNPD